jgi:hypothetical protein
MTEREGWARGHVTAGLHGMGMDTQTRSRIDVMPHLHSLISLTPLISYFRLRLTLWHLFNIHATITFQIHATITRSSPLVHLVLPSPFVAFFGGIFPGLFILSGPCGFRKALNPRLALD